MPETSLKPPMTQTPPPLEYAPHRRWSERVGEWLPQGEQVSNFFKALVWVLPLTLLIWVYAEREETVKVTFPAFPIVVNTTAPDRVVKLRYPQDGNIVVDLSGPRARVDALRERLAVEPLTLTIDPQLQLGGSQLSALTQLNNHPLFKNSGITVKACSPSSFSVDIDQMETHEAVVRAQPEAAAQVDFATFQPDRIKITAPSLYFADAERDGAGDLVVYARLANRSELRTGTGKIELDNVPLEWGKRHDYVKLSTPTVHASLSLKQADEEYNIRSVTVYKVTQAGLEDKCRVQYEVTIPNVRVIGPPDLIAMVRNDNRMVTARLMVRDVPRGQPTMGDLTFDLPPGVRLAKGTADKWEYTLVER